jgi:hypothetical protein
MIVTTVTGRSFIVANTGYVLLQPDGSYQPPTFAQYLMFNENNTEQALRIDKINALHISTTTDAQVLGAAFTPTDIVPENTKFVQLAYATISPATN